MTQRGMGRGLAAIIPDTAERPELRDLPLDLIRPNPNQPRDAVRRGVDHEPGGLDRRRGDGAAADRASARGRTVRADRRRAAVAGGQGGGCTDGPGDRSGRGRGGAPPDRVDREHGARGPEPRRRGPGLRRAGRGHGALEGGARATPQPQPLRDLEPDPPPRSSGRGARPAGVGGAQRGPWPGDPQARGNDARRRLAREAADRDWSVRETERRAKGSERTDRPARVVPHPDQEAALARAEESLERALGTGIRVRAARRGIRAELRFDDLDELHAFARSVRRS